jgi:hypothetical protein
MMTEDQIQKLEQTLELIHASLKYEKITRPKIIKIWIKAAGNYCREVADEIADS